jgi:hypothetical protein
MAAEGRKSWVWSDACTSVIFERKQESPILHFIALAAPWARLCYPAYRVETAPVEVLSLYRVRKHSASDFMELNSVGFLFQVQAYIVCLPSC